MSFKHFYKENKDLPELILVIGIPGSGKTTWIKKFNQKHYNKYHVVSMDDIRRELTGNVSDQTQNAKVVWMAKNATKRFLENGESVIFDALNVDSSYRKDLLSELPKNIILKAKILYVDPQEAKRRIRRDILTGKDRANVPYDYIDNMQKKFEHTLSVIEDEGFEFID